MRGDGMTVILFGIIEGVIDARCAGWSNVHMMTRVEQFNRRHFRQNHSRLSGKPNWLTFDVLQDPQVPAILYL